METGVETKMGWTTVEADQSKRKVRDDRVVSLKIASFSTQLLGLFPLALVFVASLATAACESFRRRDRVYIRTDKQDPANRPTPRLPKRTDKRLTGLLASWYRLAVCAGSPQERSTSSQVPCAWTPSNSRDAFPRHIR